MARPNFFNDNLNRAYPFLFKSVGIRTPATGPVTMDQLPDSFIADCGFIVGPESEFVEGEHIVYLNSISRPSATLIVFEFKSDAPGLVDSPLLFYRDPTADPKNYTSFEESEEPDEERISDSLSISFPSGDCGLALWSGYLTTGDLEDITDNLSVGSSVTRGDVSQSVVEPALIHSSASGAQVVSLNIANSDRTRALRPAGCPPYDWDFQTDATYINSICLQGDIELKAGYNVSLVQDPANNLIELSAVLNAGEGEPCEELKLFAGESPPVGSTNGLLSGDFYCNEIYKTINGLEGPNVQIYGGSGVSITSDPSSNTIIIDINLRDLQSCSYSEVSESI